MEEKKDDMDDFLSEIDDDLSSAEETLNKEEQQDDNTQDTTEEQSKQEDTGESEEDWNLSGILDDKPESETEDKQGESDTDTEDTEGKKDDDESDDSEEESDDELDFLKDTDSESETKEEAPKTEPKKGDEVKDMVQEEPKTEKKDELASFLGSEDDEFDFSPEEPTEKEVWLMAGEKGEGKTDAALSFINRSEEDTMVAIAFDNKTVRVWEKRYNKNPRVTVFNGMRYYKFSSKDGITKAAARSYKYLMKLIDRIEKVKPDWILIDNSELFTRKIAEYYARYNWKLPPFSGAEWKLWDERNHYIQELFMRCYDIAKKGVIYTTYIRQTDTLIEDGRVIAKKETPKWVDAIKYETDFVVKTWREPGSKTFLAEIISSKDDGLVPTGSIYDISDVGLWTAIANRRLRV